MTMSADSTDIKSQIRSDIVDNNESESVDTSNPAAPTKGRRSRCREAAPTKGRRSRCREAAPTKGRRSRC